jgi:hypothetical protein
MSEDLKILIVILTFAAFMATLGVAHEILKAHDLEQLNMKKIEARIKEVKE